MFFRSELHADIQIFICFLSELYFLIAKFLSAGPCKKASEVSKVLIVVFITNILHYLTDIPRLSGSAGRIGGAQGEHFHFMSKPSTRVCVYLVVKSTVYIWQFQLFLKFVITLDCFGAIFGRIYPKFSDLTQILHFQLLPKRVDWEGGKHFRSLDSLVRKFISAQISCFHIPGW